MCDFCESYESRKKCEKDDLIYVYHSALITKTYRKKDKSYAGEYTQNYFELNYCPECGEEIK